jgi:hypothetical protein
MKPIAPIVCRNLISRRTRSPGLESVVAELPIAAARAPGLLVSGATRRQYLYADDAALDERDALLA